MKQIYTKTGDEGMTSLRGGERVPKDDPRIEVNGQMDHLNALLGLVRASGAAASPSATPAGSQAPASRLLLDIQRELMVVMSHIATPQGQSCPRPLHASELTGLMEQAIDQMTAGRSLAFVIPGATLASSYVHLARTQARTVERLLWALNRRYPVEPSVMQMMNRLSDYLFALAATGGKPRAAVS